MIKIFLLLYRTIGTFNVNNNNNLCTLSFAIDRLCRDGSLKEWWACKGANNYAIHF